MSAKKTCDVFVSHAASEAKLAAEIAGACRANGLEAVTSSELMAGKDISDTLWEALAESAALLVIVSPAGPTPAMGIELGAARAWNKPIFGIVPDPSLSPLPSGLSGIHLYTPGRVDEVIRVIKRSAQELNEGDRALLSDLYAAIATPVDELALDRTRLEDLVRRFRSQTGKEISGERLLSELLRMRKQGRLARARPAGRTRPRKGTA
jgi:hypothetical protein